MDFAWFSQSLQTESRNSFPNLVMSFTYIFLPYKTYVVENMLSNSLPYASISTIGLGVWHCVVPACVRYDTMLFQCVRYDTMLFQYVFVMTPCCSSVSVMTPCCSSVSVMTLCCSSMCSLWHRVVPVCPLWHRVVSICVRPNLQNMKLHWCEKVTS